MTDVPAPIDVHAGSLRYLGLEVEWRRHRYDGGPYSQMHYRVCSYCGSIHPGDMADLLREGRSRLEGTTKAYKRYFMTPNPIAGKTVRVGSRSGPVFTRDAPRGLVARLLSDCVVELKPPVTLLERFRMRYDRPTMGTAPAEIQQKFYMEHATPELWEEIVDVARAGRSE